MGEAEKTKKSAFYVSLSKDGVTTKQVSDNISEIIEHLQEDTISDDRYFSLGKVIGKA